GHPAYWNRIGGRGFGEGNRDGGGGHDPSGDESTAAEQNLIHSRRQERGSCQEWSIRFRGPIAKRDRRARPAHHRPYRSLRRVSGPKRGQDGALTTRSRRRRGAHGEVFWTSQPNEPPRLRPRQTTPSPLPGAPHPRMT